MPDLFVLRANNFIAVYMNIIERTLKAKNIQAYFFDFVRQLRLDCKAAVFLRPDPHYARYDLGKKSKGDFRIIPVQALAFMLVWQIFLREYILHKIPRPIRLVVGKIEVRQIGKALNII